MIRQTQARGYFVQADFHPSFDLAAFARKMAEGSQTLRHLIVARGPAGEGGGVLRGLIEGMPLEAARKRLAEAPPGLGDVLSFQLSGGTTGVPKVIPRFHGEYLGHSLACAGMYKLTEADRYMWALPLLHNAAQVYVLMPVFAMGASAVLMPRVELARMLELIELHRVTHAVSIGPIAPQMMTYPDLARHDLASLRLFITMSRADRLEAHLGVPCSNLFGITEGLLLGSPADAPISRRHQTRAAPAARRTSCGCWSPIRKSRWRLDRWANCVFAGPPRCPASTTRRRPTPRPIPRTVSIVPAT